MSLSWYVIFNPAGRGKRAARYQKKLTRYLRKSGILFELAATTAAGDAEQLARQAYQLGCRHFAIAGGDGTANEVVNGVYAAAGYRPFPDVTLAILPMGSGNDWARSLNIPRRLKSACDLLSTGQAVPHDLGVVRLKQQGEARQRGFLNIAGTGLDSFLMPLIHGRSGGRWRYYLAIIRGLRQFTAPQLKVSAGDLQYDGRSLATFISIGRYLGGGLPVTPHAEPDDGLFDITVIGDVSIPVIIANLPRLFTGRLALSPWVQTTQAEQAHISCDSDIEGDGELMGQGSAEFQILKHGFKVHVSRLST